MPELELVVDGSVVGFVMVLTSMSGTVHTMPLEGRSVESLMSVIFDSLDVLLLIGVISPRNSVPGEVACLTERFLLSLFLLFFFAVRDCRLPD